MNRFDLDVVRRGSLNHELRSHLGNVLKLKAIDCVFDVGANTGQYAQLLRSLGYDGEIISFEPVSAVYDVLLENSASDAHWHCFNLALGDKHEQRSIKVYSSSVFSSFYNANDYSKKIWNSLEQSREEIVEVRRLDELEELKPLIASTHNILLKIDTQGHDSFVFQGARGLINRVAALQTEVSTIDIYERIENPCAVLEDYRQHGFYLSGAFPINREESLAVIEFDCLMVRR